MNHKDMEVWKKAVELTVFVNELVKGFPMPESREIISQLKRASISISSNIAEGSAKRSDKELLNYLYISLGSAAEIETQILIARKLNYLSESRYNEVILKVIVEKRLILGTINYIKKKSTKF